MLKSPAVVEVIRTHQPWAEPNTYEGIALRDADILEQLGAVRILRTVSKVRRDTRFVLFSESFVLRKNLKALPGQLKLDQSRELLLPRLAVLNAFLTARSRNL